MRRNTKIKYSQIRSNTVMNKEMISEISKMKVAVCWKVNFLNSLSLINSYIFVRQTKCKTCLGLLLQNLKLMSNNIINLIFINLIISKIIKREILLIFIIMTNLLQILWGKRHHTLYANQIRINTISYIKIIKVSKTLKISSQKTFKKI